MYNGLKPIWNNLSICIENQTLELNLWKLPLVWKVLTKQMSFTFEHPVSKTSISNS